MKACTTTRLDRRQCAPCHGGVQPLAAAAVKDRLKVLGGGWRVVQRHHLEKEFQFKDFKSALDFTNKVGRLAERLGHHPDIYLAWGKVRVVIWTHAVDGLTENDFVLAAKIERLQPSSA